MDNADNITDDINQDDNTLKEVEINDEEPLSDSPEIIFVEMHSFTDLANKINTYDSNVTISGLYKYNPVTDAGYANGIGIQRNSNLTIIGENAIIDGNGIARAFNIQSSNAIISLKNITFVNCYNEGNGGAILAGSPIFIDNCEFNYNTAGNGGAIYASILTPFENSSGINHTSFTGNMALNNYSAIYWKTINNDYFFNDTFLYHTNYIANQTIFKFEGNNSQLIQTNFRNNTNKICFEVVGNHIYIPGSKCYNNTGTVLKLIGDDAEFGGNLFDNSMLNNDDFAIVLIGDRPSYGGVQVKSKKSLASYSNGIGLWGTSYTGDVICYGSVNAGGLTVGGNLVTYGTAYLAGCSINGNFTSYGNGTFYGLLVGDTIYVNSNSLLNGLYHNVYNNHSEIIFQSSSAPVNMINDGGLVNFTYGSFKNSTFTNINGGKLISNVTDYECPTFTGCVFNNNGGEIDFSGNSLQNTDIINSKGKVNLENCTLINGSLTNNNGEISVTPSNWVSSSIINSNIVNNGGKLNLSNTDITNSKITNNNGEISLELVNGKYPTVTESNLKNNGGNIDATIVLFDECNLVNSKGQLNLNNCCVDDGSIVNDDKFNMDIGPIYDANIENNGVMTLKDSYCENSTITNKGTLSIEGTTTILTSKLENYGDLKVSKDANVSGLIIDKINAKVSAAKVTMNYGATKYVTIRVVDSKGNPIKNTKFTVTINKKTYQATSDANGAAKIKVPALNVGTYTVTIKGENKYCNSISPIKTTVKVNKAKTTVKVKKTVKKSKKLKITVKSKVTKKAVSKVKIKVKVYTGKKAKTYKLKTNKKGVAKLKTKKITKGKHKLVITSLNKNYKISKKIKIKVK